MTIALVHVSFGTAEEAERVGRLVVEERLAACVNLVPCASIYRWEDEVETAQEIGATFKTMPQRAAALARRITELHSYALPAIESWPAAAPDSVVEWIAAAVTPLDSEEAPSAAADDYADEDDEE
jgi:periplasmic divalent cation tolerance protein